MSIIADANKILRRIFFPINMMRYNFSAASMGKLKLA
jgi:hypothetical protein